MVVVLFDLLACCLTCVVFCRNCLVVALPFSACLSSNDGGRY